MGDVFEDVVSADEFSDADDECDDRQAPLSDDDIAHVLGLMGDGGGRPTAPTVAVASAPMPLPPPPQPPHPSAEDKKKESVKARVQEQARPPQPDVTDFDRFLADFTQQRQVVRSSTATTTTAPLHSSQPASAEQHKGQPEPPPVAAPLLCDSTPPREQDRKVTAFEALLGKTVASVELSTKSASSAPPKWGVFTPDKMPPRREFESLRVAKSPSASSTEVSPKRLKVIVPTVAYLRTKNVRAQRAYESSANKELTFRPTINKSYYRRQGMARLRRKSTLRFAARMQQDISERVERHRRREAERQKREERDARLLRERRRSLVTKGSQDILERNGLWEEPLEDRLERLLKRSSRQLKSTNVSSSVATRRKRNKLREKEAAKARTCESLYRRGVDKLQRAREEPTSASFASPDRRSSQRSESIVRDRLERDVRMICGHDSVPENNHGEGPASPLPALPASVSFVEFSCVLLYFGFVPAPNTPWEGDTQVSLLWHTWVTYAEGDGDARRVKMAVLKRLLESVIVKHNNPPGAIHRESSQGQKLRLLEIFRLNYIARKRPRGVSGEPENGTKRNDSKRHTRKSAPVMYTIHGKAVAPFEKPCDLLEVRHSLAQQRLEALRREKAQEELAECTFKPRISSTGAKESLGGYRFKEADDASISTEPEAFDRLYSDAFVRQNNSMAQYMRARREEEEKCKKEMHVSPTYVNGLTVEERLERLHESLSNNALPVHFYEKIAEMRHAYASKIEDAREKASRLETTHVFPRSKDGHTIVVPFQFATQQRTNESRRKGLTAGSRLRRDARGPQSTTSAILRDLRLHYAPHNDTTSTSYVSADEAVEADCGAADLCIDVHVSPFETYQLCLNRSDDVYAATKAFADAYNLDANQQKQLLRHAEAKLEELFDL